MKIPENKKYCVMFSMLGFFSGILYGNLVSKNYIMSMGIFNAFFLEQYRQTDIRTTEYVWYIIRIRLMPLPVLIISGTTKVRKVVVYAFLLWTCFLGGILLTSAVMNMGVKGLILCLIGMIPQAVFYTGGYLILLWYILAYPINRWNISKTICLALCMLLGILTECYVNPGIMQLFLQTL